MTDIYEQHSAAFANVSAFVIARDGQRVATIAFKFPRDGAGRLYAYIHWFGLPMVRGFAGGYGYDKKTAACASAVSNLDPEAVRSPPLPIERDKVGAFFGALYRDNGTYWNDQLREAGFEVWQAV